MLNNITGNGVKKYITRSTYFQEAHGITKHTSIHSHNIMFYGLFMMLVEEGTTERKGWVSLCILGF